jgi:dihydroorotase
MDEKAKQYGQAPSGGPLVQHALPALLDLYHEGVFSLTLIVQKACHNVAALFQIRDRGYIRPGYHADLVLADLNKPFTVTPESLLYKCRWSPFEGHTFRSSVVATMVNGTWAWRDGVVNDAVRGERLEFDR